jgi:hypothetical protein
MQAMGAELPPDQVISAVVNVCQQVTIALNQLGNGSTPQFSAAMLAWFNSLPTSLPAQPGVLWNNGGTLSQS